MRRHIAPVAILGLLGLGQGSEAASITTIYDGTQVGSLSGTMYFDVTVGDNPIVIVGFDVNARSQYGWFGFAALTMVGSHVGNELKDPLWSGRRTGRGIFGGLGLPSRVTIYTPFELQPNTTYGFALILSTPETAPGQHVYSEITEESQTFRNNDLSLTLGSYTPALLRGDVYPRSVWNGTIYYNVVPEPASLFVLVPSLVVLKRRLLARTNP